jgi:hypothetical protein
MMSIWKILEGGIKDLLDHGRESMDLVDEEHVVRLEVGQERCEVAGTFQNGARRLPEVDA